MTNERPAFGEAAEQLASRSLWVFPLSPRSKQPREGSNGFKDASIDPKRIRDWWAENENYNIGVATGPSGLVVIDIDPRHNGDESWRRLEHALGLSVDTLTSLTSGGGTHLWYRRSGRSIASGSNVFEQDYPGIDLRAAGGYVVAPPSIHPSGEPYQWDAATDLIATIPEALEAFILKAQVSRASVNPLGVNERSMIPVGNRDNSLTKIAGKLRYIGMAQDEVFHTLQLINKTRCVEPLPERDLSRIVGSVWRYAPHPTQENLVDPEVARRLVIIAAIDVVAKRTEWFIKHRIPRGEVSIFEGRGGLGKSTVALDLLARASAGLVLPGNEQPGQPANVVVFGDEDSHALIKSRLAVAEADLSKVFIVDGVGEGVDKRRFQLPQDLRLLEDAIKGYSAEVVYIDSLFNAFGPGYSQNDALDVRRVLGGLADLSHRTGATIIATRHWGKADRHEKDKGLGSVEITDVARSVISFNEDEFAHRKMKVVKHNYGQEAEDLTYKFVSHDVLDDFGNRMDVARIEWDILKGTQAPIQPTLADSATDGQRELLEYAQALELG